MPFDCYPASGVAAWELPVAPRAYPFRYASAMILRTALLLLQALDHHQVDRLIEPIEAEWKHLRDAPLAIAENGSKVVILGWRVGRSLKKGRRLSTATYLRSPFSVH